MKNKRNMLFVISIFIVIYGAFATSSQTQSKEAVMKDALSIIHSRKSVRNFTGEKVSKDDLVTALKAGMAAPTAMNKQPWSFVVITDTETIQSYWEGSPRAELFKKAGALIIVCGDPAKAAGEKAEFAVIDACLAGQNILLAIEAMGLGAVWTASYPDEERMNKARKAFGIPENIIPVCVIPVGHPTGEDMPKDKFKEENIHWEMW